MKVACDTCGTRYSIDDSRIAGKSFKVRCKQCVHVILVRGAHGPLAEPAPAPGEWHVVAGGAPPSITTHELRRLRALGTLDDRSLVWREGFADWCELGAIEELRATPPCTVEIAPDIGAVPSASSAAEPELPVLRNQRNESSVLFTLGNLARLAAPPPAASSPATGDEGSGLLDIRSLARSLAPGRTERAPVAEVPVFGDVTFGEPAVLMPRPPPGRDRRLVWVLAASVGALAIVMVILVAMILRGLRAPVHAAVAPPATPAAATAALTRLVPPAALATAPDVPAAPAGARTRPPAR